MPDPQAEVERLRGILRQIASLTTNTPSEELFDRIYGLTTRALNNAKEVG